MITTDSPEKLELEKKSKGLIPKNKILVSSSSSSSSSKEDINVLCEESGKSPFSFSESSEESDVNENIKLEDSVVVKFPKKKNTVLHYIGW